MNTTHTPGPWFTHREGFSTVYVEARIGGGLVQEVAACGPTQESGHQEANARLISAAPDMYEALKEVVRVADANGIDAHYSRAVYFVRAALAKARGQ